MHYDVVLLDIDGTIVDSNDAHARAWEKAFAQHGRAVAFERIRPLIGMVDHPQALLAHTNARD